MMLVNDYYFESVAHALGWSTEVLRQRRFPKIAQFYQEATPEHPVAPAARRVRDAVLPTLPEDKAHLASKVFGLLQSVLTEAERDLLLAQYWGDYWHPDTLRQAQAFQERCRRDGVRVCLSYRYSYRQLAVVFQVSDKTVAKRCRAGEEKVAQALTALGYLPVWAVPNAA